MTTTTDPDGTAVPDDIKRDAVEFGAHSSPQRNWRLGLLVARNVLIKTAGRPRKPESIITGYKSPKVTALEFSTLSGVSQPTISWHLKAWDLAVTDGVDIPASKDLVPGEEVSPLPPGTLWSKYYNLARHGSEIPPKAAPKPAPKAAAPAKKTAAKVPTPGAVTMTKIDKLKAARADFPTETKDGIAKIAGLAGHQEVRLLELISDAPSEMMSMIEHDELKLSVAQEILEAPLLDATEKTALARKFVAGTFPQVGQAKKVFRPIVAFAQNARPAAREMLLTDVSATVEQVEAAFPPDEKREPKPDPTAATKWSINFSKEIGDQKNIDQRAIVRLTDSRHAAEMMKAIDPYTMSFVVKDMQRIREMLITRYEELEWWITALAGAEHVNYPTSTATGTATVEADIIDVDADAGADAGADIIDITSKRARPGSLHVEGMTIDG